MDENIVTVSVVNTATVTLMAGVGFAAIGLLMHLVHKFRGADNA